MTTFTGLPGSDILPGLLGALLALGDDEFYGYDGDDLLIGFLGDDTFEGGAGADIIIGGVLDVNLLARTAAVSAAGEDTATYAASAQGVTVDLGTTVGIDLDLLGTGISVGVIDVTLGEGGDAAGDILIGISHLAGSAHADRLAGNDGNNRIFGGDGADSLAGGGGSDKLVGQDGADTIDGGDGQDRITAGDGADLLFGGAHADVIEGNAGFDLLYGGSGNDLLDGGVGADTMHGGTGDDIYHVNSRGDLVIEAAGEGTDLISSTVTVNLATLAAEVEDLELDTAGGAINGLGNDLDNAITGNLDDNILRGGGGGDTLTGRGGVDRLYGDSGQDVLDGGIDDDTLDGGGGDDLLTGGAGGDTFVFAGQSGQDIVTDFDTAADVIDLSGIPAIGSFASLVETWLSEDGSGNAVIAIGARMVTLLGVGAGDLAADDFLF
jgi:Ca2+-binding RTX toxin-like protein